MPPSILHRTMSTCLLRAEGATTWLVSLSSFFTSCWILLEVGRIFRPRGINMAVEIPTFGCHGSAIAGFVEAAVVFRLRRGKRIGSRSAACRCLCSPVWFSFPFVSCSL